MYIHTCIYTYMFIDLFIYVETCGSVHIYIYIIHIYICVCVRMYIYIYRNIPRKSWILDPGPNQQDSGRIRIIRYCFGRTHKVSSV